MQKYTEKTKQYVALSTKTFLTKEEAQKLHHLRRELTAKGLDPAHENGLVQRANILDHKAKCANYVALRDDDKRNFARANELADLGIKPDKLYLERILREIEQNAKQTDKKITSRRHGTSPARIYADQKLAEFEAEMAIEEDPETDTAFA